MKRVITSVLFGLPLWVFAQFGTSEFYAVTKIGFGMGMNSYTYNTVLNNSLSDGTKSLQIELGKGFSPEVGLGLKLTNLVYLETSLSYTINKEFYNTQYSGQIQEQGYSFNRFNFHLNGKYFVEVNPTFLLDFNAGLLYSIPNDLIIKLNNETHRINYAGTTGIQAGFGATYVVNNFNFKAGIRYRIERFNIKPKQNLPYYFEYLNSNFNQINSNGIDILLAVRYHF
ncbi:outer membrane beta-barrel protein [bacterium SCSIO 12643]|nr:outer membrane beta-barrel protein [bacterium SCSIO 12643]